MKKTKSITRKIVIRIVILIACWCAFFFTDYSLAKANKDPIFCIPLITYKDGGSAQYFGLGYKVNVYVKMMPEANPEIENVRVDFGSWDMKFDIRFNPY